MFDHRPRTPRVPPRLAWPLTVASSVMGLGAAGLISWSVASGSITAALGAASAAVAAAVLWHLADFAANGS